MSKALLRKCVFTGAVIVTLMFLLSTPVFLSAATSAILSDSTTFGKILLTFWGLPWLGITVFWGLTLRLLSSSPQTMIVSEQPVT